MNAHVTEQSEESFSIGQGQETKLPWKSPSVEDLHVAVGTQSVGLGNNDGAASHT